MSKKVTRKEMVDFITKIAKDCGQVQLDSFCGKYFNVLYDDGDVITVESFEKNDTYDFTDIKDLSDRVVGKIYKSLLVDFA